MTASFSQPRPARSGPSVGAALVLGVVATIGVFTLIIIGMTFAGLAIAFPIALPVAEAYHLPVPPADAALAERLAAFWWAFAGLAVAAFVGAGVVIVKVADILSPRGD
jgi:hypothetical protein